MVMGVFPCRRVRHANSINFKINGTLKSEPDFKSGNKKARRYLRALIKIKSDQA
jgi:hypothetical protein